MRGPQAGGVAALSDDGYAFLDESGEPVRYEKPKDWVDPLPLPSEAAQDCLLIADYLERVIASAKEQGLIPDGSIAFDNIDDAIAFLESL